MSEGLRVYPAKFKGPVVLVCRKCEKKLDGFRVKKALKKLAKRDVAPVGVHVVAVGCMKLCPKGGVAVCPQTQMREVPVGLSIVRTKSDVAMLYEGLRV